MMMVNDNRHAMILFRSVFFLYLWKRIGAFLFFVFVVNVYKIEIFFVFSCNAGTIGDRFKCKAQSIDKLCFRNTSESMLP